MISLQKYFYLIILSLFSLNACLNTANNEDKPTALSQKQITQIDSICQAYIDKGNTIGLSMGIAHNGKVLFSNGYGLANIESQKPATDQTIYPIASVSKFITAITTMQMVEQGKLSLDDKMTSYFDDFPQQEFMDEITIEHLLRHQSGLVDYEDWVDSIYIHHKRVFTNEELYEFLDQPLFFHPGSLYSYSNTGYGILSSILEQIEQKSFHEVIDKYINVPLETNLVGMWPEQWHHDDATMGYELTDNGVDTSFHMMTAAMKGDGSLSSSVLNLLKIANGITEESLLSKASLDQMLTPTPIGNISIDYGLGVKFGNYVNQKTFGHSGGYKGTGWSMLVLYPESGYSFAAIMNTNYSPEEIWALRYDIMPLVLNVLEPKMESKPIENIEQYAGEYQSFNRWGSAKPSRRIFSIEDGRLFRKIQDSSTPATELFEMDHHVFSWEPFPYDEFKFHEVDGKIVACSEYADGMFVTVKMKND